MKLFLRGGTVRFVARPVQIVVSFETVPGVTRVDARDSTTAYVGISSWAWSLKKGGVEVATSSVQNPSFTSLVAGSDYSLTLTVISDVGATDSDTFGDFTVDPGTLATPSAVVPGTVSGLTIPLTIVVPAEPTLVEQRRLFYSLGSAPTEADSFELLDSDDTSYDFVADSTGTWHFKLQDIAVDGLATDSALSADASAVISAGGGSPPGAPTLVSVTAINSHRIDLVWTSAQDAQHNIYRFTGDDPDFTPNSSTLLIGERPASLQSYSDQTVAPETTYTYKIETVNTVGQEFSEGIADTTPAQEDWPDNEPSGVGLVSLFTPYQGTGGKQWAGNFFNYSAGWLTGVGPDGTTLRVEEIDDATSKFGKCLIKRHWEAESGTNDSGWLGAFVSKVHFGGGGFRRLYLRFVFQLSANYQGHASGTNKLVYFGGISANKANVYYIGATGGPTATSFSITIDADTSSSGTREYRSAVGPVFGRGVWHTLEMYLIASSVPGAFDATGRVWVDGSMVDRWNCVPLSNAGPGWVNGSNLDNINFTGAGDTSVLFDGTQFPLYFGGSGTSLKLVDDHIKVGEFYWSGAH